LSIVSESEEIIEIYQTNDLILIRFVIILLMQMGYEKNCKQECSVKNRNYILNNKTGSPSVPGDRGKSLLHGIRKGTEKEAYEASASCE